MSLRADLFEANSLSGSVRVLNGYANVELGIRPFALEGNISFIVDLRTGSVEGDILVSTPPITLVDLSEIVSFTSNNNVMNEGDLITYTLTTQNAANNSVVYYSTRSLVSNVNVLDFDGGNTGSITIVDNVGTVTLRANLDNSTIVEAGEQFELEVRTGSSTGTVIANTTNSVTIADTSNAIGISGFSLSSNVVYETSEVVFRIDTRNGIGNAAGTYYYTVTGNADLYTATSGEIVINDDVGYVNVIPEASVSSNEIRDFTLQIRTGSVSGPIIYSTANVFVYDNSAAGLQATGGNISIIGDYKIHTFENTGTFKVNSFSSISSENNLEILLVAGGGGGYDSSPYSYQGPSPSPSINRYVGAAGGGGGGVLYFGSEEDINKAPNGSLIDVQTFGSNITSGSGLTIFVGGGGNGLAGSGSNTYIANNNIGLNNFIAVGGGGAGKRGGSGGGAIGVTGPNSPPQAGLSGYPGQGYAGGTYFCGPLIGGAVGGTGGGGAGSLGQSMRVGTPLPVGVPDATTYSQAANGGIGVYYTISGVGKWYAGGGGGMTRLPPGSGGITGLGGSGVGGDGVISPGAGNGTPNPGQLFSGGGGGGGGSTWYPVPNTDTTRGNPSPGGSGGPGIAILRYRNVFNPKVSSVTTVLANISTVSSIGQSISFTVSTVNSSNGEVLYYSANNQPNAAFTTGNTGSFLVNANTGTIILNPTVSIISENYLDLQIRRNSSDGAILKTGGNVYIPSLYTQATGGNISVSDGYRIHTFTTSSNLEITSVGLLSSSVEVLMVAGGGGGGSAGSPVSGNPPTGVGPSGSGGGAGGLISTNVTIGSAGSYSVVIGGGGIGEKQYSLWPAWGGVPTVGRGTPGSNTTVFSLVSVGGGGGGKGGGGPWPGSGIDDTATGFAGGSGAGATYTMQTVTQRAGALGFPDQGNPGGAGSPRGYEGNQVGGGGGRGQIGAPSAQAGHGGNGISISWVTPEYGTPGPTPGRWFAGGGGAGGFGPINNPTGGFGGGGKGAASRLAGNTLANSGTVFTGGGGGGGTTISQGWPSSLGIHSAGDGGSGIVIIRYPYA